MSDPIDIKALDEYLKGGSEISQRYRALGSDEVSPELDRRVLDEARAAVASGSGGRSRSWLRWSAPLALAATVVLAVAVVIESGVQNDASFATERKESKLQEQVAQQPSRELQRQFAPEPPAAMAPQAPVPAAAPPAASGKAEAERANNVAPSEEVRADAKALRNQPQMTSPVAVITAVTDDSPAPQAAAEPPATPPSVEVESADEAISSVSSTGTRARRTGRSVGARGTISGSALSSETRPSPDADASDLRSDPLKWLESIRELRRTGKAEEADRAWQEFHQAFPNFPVADDDLARQQR